MTTAPSVRGLHRFWSHVQRSKKVRGRGAVWYLVSELRAALSKLQAYSFLIATAGMHSRDRVFLWPFICKSSRLSSRIFFRYRLFQLSTSQRRFQTRDATFFTIEQGPYPFCACSNRDHLHQSRYTFREANFCGRNNQEREEELQNLVSASWFGNKPDRPGIRVASVLELLIVGERLYASLHAQHAAALPQGGNIVLRGARLSDKNFEKQLVLR